MYHVLLHINGQSVVRQFFVNNYIGNTFISMVMEVEIIDMKMYGTIKKLNAYVGYGNESAILINQMRLLNFYIEDTKIKTDKEEYTIIYQSTDNEEFLNYCKLIATVGNI